MSDDFEEETGTFRMRILRDAFELVGLPKEAAGRKLENHEIDLAVYRASALPQIEREFVFRALYASRNKQYEQLKDSGIDPLTTLSRREKFEEAFERELENLRKTPGKAIAFGIIDIDHFKRYNDNFGHQVGDFILRKTGVRLKKTVRANDFTGRWGGEELVFLLVDGEVGKNMLSDPLKRLAKRLCEFSKYDRDTAHRYEVRSSIGVVVVTHKDALRLSSAEIFKIADKKLYEIKRSGRCRMEVIDNSASWGYRPSNDNDDSSRVFRLPSQSLP